METIIIMAMLIIPIFIFMNVVCLFGELINKKESKQDKIEGAVFCLVNIIAFCIALFL